MHILMVKFLQSIASSVHCYFSPFRSTYSPWHTDLKLTQSVSFPRHMRKLSHQQHTTTKITILYTVISMVKTTDRKTENYEHSQLFTFL